MKSLLLLIFVTFLLTCYQSAFAQTAPKAGLFDSWGRINSEDHSARLDNIAIGLQNDSALRAYFICYGPEGEGSGSGKAIITVMNDYLVNTRGVDPDRVDSVYAGRYKDPSAPWIEVWLVPTGATTPEPARFDGTPPVRRGKVGEHIGSDDSSEIDECGCGPPQGYVEGAALADSLRTQSSDVAYIVAYNLKTSAPGAWRRVGEQELQSLQSYGIDAARIKLIFGGTAAKVEEDEDDSSGQVKVEIWVLPKDSPPPVKEAKAETTLKHSILLGEYNGYSLTYPDEQKRIFGRIVDVLRVDQLAILCLIVRPSAPPEWAPDVLPDIPDDIDTVKLAEKWRTELTEKLGIKANRIVLIPGSADDDSSGSIEVWVVPPGAELPKAQRVEEDPNPAFAKTSSLPFSLLAFPQRSL